MAALMPQGKQQYFTAGGIPLVGGKVYTYAAGTTTPLATYTDAAAGTPNTNPVILDSRGEASIFFSAANYKIVVKDSLDSTIWTQDNLPGDQAATILANLAASTGSSLVGFIQSGTGAVARTLQSKNRDIVSIYDFGAVGDGTTDDSTVVQACIDAHKGKTITIPYGTPLVAGLLLSGATYDGTRVICTGGELKLKADAGASTFDGCWIGLLVKECDRVYLDLAWNGNRAAMTDREQIFCVGIAGASNTKIPNLTIREIRGDGLYISQSSYTGTSTTPTNTEIGTVTVTNTADDGRNAVSVIAANGLTIDTIVSRKVGGTVGGALMPGGLDIEPDFGYQPCTDITIGTVQVTTAGTAGCGILGKAITNDAARDWNCTHITIKNFDVHRTGTAGSGLAAASFVRYADSEINGTVRYTGGTKGKGVNVDYAQRVTGRVSASTVTQGFTIGTVNEVRDFEFDVRVTDYNTAGLRPCAVTRGKFTGHIYGASAASTAFAIQCHDEGRGAITQTDITYEIDAPYDGANARAFRNEPGNSVLLDAACVVQNCSYYGYANPQTTIDAEIKKVNVKGLSFASAIPSGGTWRRVDFVTNTGPALDANGMIQLGWVRLTTGSANVAGTDWAYVYTSNVSPAI